ncbi:MAG: hypothetical protein QG670_913 [Thermoproteota archaeon]|nr:hypothetical protein [Thermoproteota archaeon]
MIVLKTEVAIVRGKEPSRMVEKALDIIDAKKVISPDDRILIKPNYVVAKASSTGITTDSRVIESLIEFLKNKEVKQITVGEGGSGDTDRAFEIVGIKDVTIRQKVKLVNLNRDLTVKMKIQQALALNEVNVAKTAIDSTCIINVPKLKIHHMALVTVSMKNLMGVILPKSIMHDQLDEKIVDLASILKDKVKLNVVDCIVGAEENETYGSPVQMDLIIAGRDMVAVDSVSAAVMGMDPRKVKYLRLAEERGLGISNLEEIEVLGESIKAVEKKFRLS